MNVTLRNEPRDKALELPKQMEGQPVQQDPPPNGLPLEGHVPRQQQLPATQDDAAHPLLRRAVVADVPRLERCQSPGRGFSIVWLRKACWWGLLFGNVLGWRVGKYFSTQNP